MIVYFTGTGNSRYAAQFLAQKLKDTLVDAGELIRAGASASLRSETPWVFVCPTYAWQIPHIFRNWILEGDFRGCRDAYFVMTCGDGVGKADQKNENLCFRKAFRYMGTAKVIMPENYIAMFDAPTEEEAAQIRLDALPILNQTAEQISSHDVIEPLQHGALDSLMSGLVNTIFCKAMVKTEGFHVTDMCIGCGLCTSSCVCNNITLINGKPKWEDQCIHCMACICGCPSAAIEYGKKSRGRVRYHCPEYHSE